MPENPPSPGAWGLRFVPERLTPLPFTGAWARLRPHEQLRYNQLHGLYGIEQIIFFEQKLIIPLLAAARANVRDPALLGALDTFVAEEQRHSAAFHGMLRDLRPEWYCDGWQHFVRLGPMGGGALAAMANHPRQFPFLFWLVQLLEERTMFASRLYLDEADQFPSPLVALHRMHIADEADHLRWDMALISHFWEGAPGWKRRVNARLLDWVLGEFVAVPRRAAMRVVDALAADIPDLSVPPAALKAEQVPGFEQGIQGKRVRPRFGAAHLEAGLGHSRLWLRRKFLVHP
jgi:hypothetical protein